VHESETEPGGNKRDGGVRFKYTPVRADLAGEKAVSTVRGTFFLRTIAVVSSNFVVPVAIERRAIYTRRLRYENVTDVRYLVEFRSDNRADNGVQNVSGSRAYAVFPAICTRRWDSVHQVEDAEVSCCVRHYTFGRTLHARDTDDIPSF